MRRGAAGVPRRGAGLVARRERRRGGIDVYLRTSTHGETPFLFSVRAQRALLRRIKAR